MEQLKKDLKAVEKDLKKLTQKTEEMIKQLEKAQAPRKAKPRATRKAVAKKPTRLSAT